MLLPRIIILLTSFSVLYNIDSAVLLFYNTIIHTHTHILGIEMLLKKFYYNYIYDHADLQ